MLELAQRLGFDLACILWREARTILLIVSITCTGMPMILAAIDQFF
jgi:hypothetical protein